MTKSDAKQRVSPKHILVTGGAGFIGSNFIRLVLRENPTLRVTNLDKLTYAGNLDNLTDIAQQHSSRYAFERGDICDGTLVGRLLREVDGVVHFAAESHVDRSILNGRDFLETNVMGTHNLVDCLRRETERRSAADTTHSGHSSIRMLHVSTDEVYGALGEDGAFTEETPLAPNSPYSASKAASDFVVRAAFHTHHLDVVTTRCSNNYGPYHFPEKLIPLMITNAMENTPLPVYGQGLNVRDWIHVEDHCKGVWAVFQRGRSGEVYNLGGKSEWRNIDVVREILKILKKDESLLSYVEDRKGHDFRYAIDCSKAEKELGWTPKVSFHDGLRQTVEWYQDHQEWWKKLKGKAKL